MRTLTLALLLSIAALAQPIPPQPGIIKGNPPGGIGAACSGTPLLGYLNASGQVITCPASHVWTVTGGLALPACSSTVTSNCVVTASASHNVELYVPCGAQAPAGSLCINAAAFDADMSDGRLEVQGPANAARPVASFGYVNRAAGSTTASQVLYLTAYNGGSGTIDALRSDYRDIENYGGGSVADAVSNYTFYGNTLGSSVGNFYGSWIDTSNAGSLVNFYGSYIAKPSATGTTTNSYGQWIGDFAGFGTNPYYSWFDSRGVRRVKEDSSFDSVGQAIEALYNPQFAKYTPGATDFERIVLGRWNGNVAEIGAEKGGTGTLRALNLIGSSVTAPTPTALDNSNKVATTAYVDSAVSGGVATAAPPYVTVGGFAYGPISLLTTPAGSFSWLNQNGSTVTSVNGAQEFSIVPTAAVDHLTCYMQNIPGSAGADYTGIIALSGVGLDMGVGISDGTKVIVMYTGGGQTVIQQKWDSTTSFNSGYWGPTALWYQSPLLWVRIQQSGPTRTTMISADGRNWILPNSSASQSKDDFLTETKFGMCQETNAAFTPKFQVVSFSLSNP